MNNATRARRKFVEEMHWNKVLAKPGIHEFVIVLDGLKPSFNIAKIFRSAYAMGAAEIHLVNIAQFNPFPAMGACRYVMIKTFQTLRESIADLEGRGYRVFALEASAEQSLAKVTLPEKSAFIMGHEQFGVSVPISELPTVTGLRIPMAGGIESLNVSIAATLTMYEYMRQWGKENELRKIAALPETNSEDAEPLSRNDRAFLPSSDAEFAPARGTRPDRRSR